jgi:hypothetical protein
MSAVEERIVELRLGQKMQADSHRDFYEDRWIKNWSLYRNTRQTRSYKMQPWNSNRQIPDAFRVVETMLPQHVLGMFRNPNWFSVEAPTAAGQVYQDMVRSLLLQFWRKADGFKKTVDGMKMGTILGHFCPKTTWKQEIGELVIQDTDYNLSPEGEPMGAEYVERTVPHVKHNGPQVEFPDLFNLWQDPTGAGMFWIERIPTSFSRLEDTNRKFNGNLYKNLNKLKAQIQLNPSPKTTRYSSGAQYDQPLSTIVDGVPEQFADDSVELLQCWGYVPPSIKKYEDTQWRLQIVANDECLIRDEPAPTHDHRAPYDNVQSVPIPGQIYGDSVLSYVGDLIELRSEFENMRRDEAMLNIYQTHWIDGRAQIRGQDMIKQPGGAMRIMPHVPDADVSRMFGTIPRQPVLPEAYQESAIKESQIDQTAGTFKTFQGQAFGGRTAAAEVNAIMNVGTARFQLATMLMDEAFKRPVLTRMFKLAQSKMTMPEVVNVVGYGDLWGEIDFSDLRYDVDVYVDSGLYGSMDAQQAQNITQLYQVLLSNPEAAAYIDVGKLAKALNYRLGLSGTSDNFIRSEDEARQIIQAQQQAAMQAAAAGEGAAG